MAQVLATDTGVQQSSDFWFADGNVVLEAEHTRFRVHQGILARHSLLFRDMFSLPMTFEQPCLEGVPIVNVMDDADSWTYVLTVLYDCISSSDLLILQALTLIRIARKYQFDRIHLFAMRRLQGAFPRTYQGFVRSYNLHLRQCAELEECHCGETCDIHEVIKFINYAVEWDIPEILPVAYYLVSGLKVKQVLRGIERPSDVDGRPSILCRDAQEALLIGQPQLEKRFFRLVLPWIEPGGSECPVGLGNRCHGEPSHCLKIYKKWEESHIISRHLLPDRWHMVFFKFGISHMRLCGACEALIKQHFWTKREQLWDEMPTIFGLPGWGGIASTEGSDI